MVCTASAGLIDRLTAEGVISESRTSEYAAEGTVAHSIREACLRGMVEPFDFVGQTLSADGFSFLVTEEMAEYLQGGIDWVREHTFDPDVEIRVDLTPWVPAFGTCDTGWIEGNTLYISDLKYGAGVPVDAVGSRQLRLYALGYWHYKGRPDIDTVVINIDQPRAGGMKFWEISLQELLAFGEEVRLAAQKIAAGDVEFSPGEKQCKWCPVKDTDEGCAAYDRFHYDMFEGAFDDLDDEPKFVAPAHIEDERVAFIVKNAAAARKWLAELHQYAIDRGLEGNPLPGTKVVEGRRGDRRFTDPEEAEFWLFLGLGDNAYKPREVISLSQAEKLLKPGSKRKRGDPLVWAKLDALIHQPDGGPTIADADDPRPALSSIDHQFDDLD